MRVQFERRLAAVEAALVPGLDVFDPTDPASKARIDAIRAQIRSERGMASAPSTSMTPTERRRDCEMRKQRVADGVGSAWEQFGDRCRIRLFELIEKSTEGAT